MNEDFQKRLARLEAKHGPSSIPSYDTPRDDHNPATADEIHYISDDGGKSRLLKMMLLGLACLIVLPAGAAFAVIKLPDIQKGAGKVFAMAEIWNDMESFERTE